jgi:hypothetical protein
MSNGKIGMLFINLRHPEKIDDSLLPLNAKSFLYGEAAFRTTKIYSDPSWYEQFSNGIKEFEPPRYDYENNFFGVRYTEIPFGLIQSDSPAFDVSNPLSLYSEIKNYSDLVLADCGIGNCETVHVYLPVDANRFQIPNLALNFPEDKVIFHVIDTKSSEALEPSRPDFYVYYV